MPCSHPVTSQPKELANLKWLDAPAAQAEYGGSAIQAQRTLAGAFIVNEQDDIAAVLKWAGSNGAAIHPISSGRNWGYGSALPVSTDDNVYLLDLSALKEVIDFDEELGLITLEPGVTQADLVTWLDERGYDYMVPVTGAGPNCSIVGNALERGYGITPYAEHFAAATSMKAYMADGEIYRSSIRELLEEHKDPSQENPILTADRSFKWKLGPYLDGIFTQSNLGVVSEMTFRLAKRPKGFESFYVQFAKDEDLETAVELMQGILRDYEGIVGSINLMDRRRILSMVAENPNGPAAHQVMSEEQCKSLAKKFQVPAWMLVGSIYGMPNVVKVARRDIRCRVWKHASRTIFSEGWLLKFANLVLKILPNWMLKNEREQLQALAEGIEIMVGKPNQVALPLAYWRNPHVRPSKGRELNPAKDNCGLMWYAPLVPTKAKDMREFATMIREICPKYNIEPLITLTNFHHDSTDSTIPILFDATNPEAVADAKACLEELVAKGLATGYVPYRMNIEQQGKLLNADKKCWQLVRKLKEALDPEGVIAPGRYNPSENATKPKE